MTFKKLYYSVILSLCLIFSLAICVSAHDADWTNTGFATTGFDNPAALNDANYNSYTSAWTEATITLSRSDEIHSLYIVFDRIPPLWTLTDPVSGQNILGGTNAFLHEYIDIASCFDETIQTLTLTFPAGTVIADIYAFSSGALPDWVEMWQPPCEEADLLLFTSHSDDEQLFFAGLLPLYAGERQFNVQVAYIVQHFQVYNELVHNRPHEQLNGLWAVGVTNYPVMSDFPDLYSESLEGAISVFNSVGVTENDYASYMTECLRRFKPLVVVSHDTKGEYSHGTHILCTKTLMDILEYSDDPSVFPESAQKYGTWMPEKVYLHLYPENPIVLDLDIPLPSFDGKTAFEMTQHGFSFHKSQHWTWFYKWIYGSAEAPITKASQITAYSPCFYGLYHTTVGYDTIGKDLFENIIPYRVRNEATETTSVPETEFPETEVLETETQETVPPVPLETTSEKPLDTDSTETDFPNMGIHAGKSDRDFFANAVIGILAAAMIAVIAIYLFALSKLKRGKNKRHRRK